MPGHGGTSDTVMDTAGTYLYLSLHGSRAHAISRDAHKHFPIKIQVGNNMPQHSMASPTLGWHHHCALSKEVADVRELDNFLSIFSLVFLFHAYLSSGKKMSMK